MKSFKDILEDVYTSEYKEKQFVGQDGKTHTRKVRPHRIDFKNSKSNAEPAEKNEMQEDTKIQEGLHPTIGLPNSDRTDKKGIEANPFRKQKTAADVSRINKAKEADKKHTGLYKKQSDSQRKSTVKSYMDMLDSLGEAVKIGSKVTMHSPGKDYHGQVGHVGEIRNGAYKGADKTYTVDYDNGKSVQLGKNKVKLHKEETRSVAERIVVAKEIYNNKMKSANTPDARAQAKEDYDHFVKSIKEQVELEEAISESAPFKKLEHAVAYATDKVKTHRDNLDGIEVYKHKSGGYDVNHTMNANGRKVMNTIGAKHLGTVYKDKPANIKEETIEQRAKEMMKAKKQVKEAKDEKEYGYEGDMALNQLSTLTRCADMIKDMLKPETDLPEWVQSKITLATDYIQTAADYMYSEMNEELKGKQHKIDKNKNGKIDGQDFKLLRKEEEVHNESTVPDNMKGKQKPYVSSDGKGNYEVLGNTGQTKATFTRKEHGQNAQAKAREHVKKNYDTYMKEDLEEAFINGRDFASHGLMHPDHAKQDIHKVSGQHVDFYATKTGDKMQGKVVKNDGKSVHIQAHKELGDGKLHKFSVTSKLPTQNNEGTTLKSYKEFMTSLDEAMWPGTPEYNKKFPPTATDRNKGSSTSTTHGKAIGTGTGVKHERDYEKAEKETPAEKTEKRGRGRPAGSTSGARQKGTIAKSEYAGADYTGHKMHLPNRNK